NKVKKISGCYVDSQTFKAAKNEKCLWTWNIVAQNITTATSFTGTGSQSTTPPLDWSGVKIKWTGEDDSATYHSGCTSIEFTVANNLDPINDLTQTGQDRQTSDFLMGKRDISGTMMWYMKTTEGQRWDEVVFSATVDKTTPDNTIQLGEFWVEIHSATASRMILYKLFDFIISELPEDVDFEKVTEISLPFTARYASVDILTMNIANEPARWDSQVA
ncbi:hypothetical protein LCGC14_3154260, partial [marine sediment metagenome]